MTPPHARLYWIIWAALMVLLVLTYAIANVHLGPLNVLAAMTIAVAKMVLVLLFFMHVRYSRRLTWIFAGAGFFWLLIMISLTLGDYIGRGLEQ